MSNRAATVNVQEFRDDDGAYLDWVGEHDHGYVINIRAGLNPSDARLHSAECRTITGQPSRGSTWTGHYIKVCSASLPGLDAWARKHAGAPIQRCRTCQPPGPAGAENLASSTWARCRPSLLLVSDSVDVVDGG
jgi:hypothetical protein